MEVAEGVTKAIGDPELLEAMGLGERPSPEAITALGAGRHGVTGEQLVAPRAGLRPGRLQRPRLLRPQERQRGVRRGPGRRRLCTGGAAGRGHRGVGPGRAGHLLPAPAGGSPGSPLVAADARPARRSDQRSLGGPAGQGTGGPGPASPRPHPDPQRRPRGGWEVVGGRLPGPVPQRPRAQRPGRGGDATPAPSPWLRHRGGHPQREARERPAPDRAAAVALVRAGPGAGGGAHRHVRPKPGGDPARRGRSGESGWPTPRRPAAARSPRWSAKRSGRPRRRSKP